MPKKKKPLDRLTDLTWDDLEEWAGSRIVGRGRSYQKQGRVSDLAMTDDGALIAWVQGSRRYATKVVVDEDAMLGSVCTCPYGLDCKHGVAVVLEYLEHIEENRPIPGASKDDERLLLLEHEDWDDDEENHLPEDFQKEIEAFLKSKTKSGLIELVLELARQYPEMAQDLADRQQVASGNAKALVTRLRREIRDMADEPGWQNYWRGEGYTPDYSGIRTKLEALLKAGHADDVLAVGGELLTTGTRQVEESHDEGETATEIAACMPVIVRALDRSSLEPAGKLGWAVDAVLKDQFGVCDAFAEYLHRKHPKAAWNALADQLLARLRTLKRARNENRFSSDFARDQLSDWTIHALERARRSEEIISLCEAEAEKTGSYDRLVRRLIDVGRYEDAERWIQKGIKATKEKWPGMASSLRGKLLEIRTRQKDWPAVAAIQVETFVRHPSRRTFTDCRKVAAKVKAWPTIRGRLLDYLERGMLPWKQKGWPFPESGLDAPEPSRQDRFPMIEELIDIAIYEKKPDMVLHWYDQLPQRRRSFGWYGIGEDSIAKAVQSYAPDRAVAIWKGLAERLIAQVKPSAYREAAKYLRKAGRLMTGQKKQEEWRQYLQDLREKHARKRRLMEILDALEGNRIVKKRR